MIRVQTIGVSDVRIQPRPNSYDAGDGVTVYENSASTPAPVVSNGILLEDLVYFLMMEDTTSYLLQEA
jgi:hypothetical protein